MKNNNLLNITDDFLEDNMVLLIEDEDQELSGASYWEAITAVTGITAIFQITTACTTRCYKP